MSTTAGGCVFSCLIEAEAATGDGEDLEATDREPEPVDDSDEPAEPPGDSEDDEVVRSASEEGGDELASDDEEVAVAGGLIGLTREVSGAAGAEESDGEIPFRTAPFSYDGGCCCC